MTILSRCQRFDFRRISIDEIIARLRFIAGEEKVTIDDEALTVIAKKGDGSLRDAQSIFDQVRSYCGNEIKVSEVLSVLNAVDQEQFFRVSALIKEKNVRGGIELVDELMQHGHDLREFVGGLAEHFRNILVAKTTESTHLIETSEPYKRRYESLARECSEQDLLRLIKIAQDLEQSIRWVFQPRYKLEIALLQMIKMENSVRIDDLLSQIAELKRKVNEGPTALPASPVKFVSQQIDGTVAAPRASSEVKVIGTVSAGPLRSASYVRPAAKYQPLDLTRAVSSPSAYSVRDPGFEKAVLQAVEVTPTPAVLVSTEEVEIRWPEFVEGVTKAKIALGSVLTESHFVGYAQGVMRIGCPDEYHLSMLKRNKDFLSETLKNVLGVQMSVEPVLHAVTIVAQQQTARVRHNNPQLPNGNGGRVETSAQEHPLLTLMRKELGAEPIH